MLLNIVSIIYIKGCVMATLRGLLDQVTELLQYEGKYKSFGDLQKAKYQQ